jgi:membrane protein DedA with SNARE-associated domain
MPLGRFVLFSTLGSLPWNAALIYAGFVVGENYPQIEAALKPYEYVIYLGVLAVVAFVVVRWWLAKRRRSSAT